MKQKNKVSGGRQTTALDQQKIQNICSTASFALLVGAKRRKPHTNRSNCVWLKKFCLFLRSCGCRCSTICDTTIFIEIHFSSVENHLKMFNLLHFLHISSFCLILIPAVAAATTAIICLLLFRIFHSAGSSAAELPECDGVYEKKLKRNDSRSSSSSR